MIDRLEGRWIAPGLIVLALSCAGGSEPAALSVGSLSFSAEEVGHLPPARLERLAAVAALANVVAEDRLGQLAEALTEPAADSVMAQRLAIERALASAGWTEVTLRAAYAQEPEPELRVRHLVVVAERWQPAAERDAARRRALEARRRAERGEDFAQLAAEVSEEPGARARGGLLEPGREGSWVPEFWAAALALEPGEISPVIETRYGYHVLRLEERRAVPFEAARARFAEHVVRPGEVEAARRDLMAQLPSELAVDTAAFRRYLAVQAREAGIELAPPERRGLQENWSARLEALSQALGLVQGMDASDRKAAALRALGESAQGTRIAVEEVWTLLPTLQKVQPIRWPAYAAE